MAAWDAEDSNSFHFIVCFYVNIVYVIMFYYGTLALALTLAGEEQFLPFHIFNWFGHNDGDVTFIRHSAFLQNSLSNLHKSNSSMI